MKKERAEGFKSIIQDKPDTEASHQEKGRVPDRMGVVFVLR